MKQLKKKVEVLEAKCEEGDDGIKCMIQYASYDVVVNQDLSLALLSVRKKCTMHLMDFSDYLECGFDFDQCSINTKIPLSTLKNKVWLNNRDFYMQNVQFQHMPALPGSSPLNTARLKYNSCFDNYDLPGEDQAEYPLFETLYWISRICELTYIENNIPFPIYPETPENQATFATDILPLLTQNLSCLPHPGISF